MSTINRLVLAAAGGVFAAAAPAAGQSLFDAPFVPFNGPTSSSGTGDFDGDGLVEFVVSSSRMMIYAWDPDTNDLEGTEIVPQNFPGRGNRYGGDIVAGDVDGDGHVDLIVPNSNNGNGPGDVFWYRNPGYTGQLPGGVDHWDRTTIATWPNRNGDPDQRVAHMSEIEAGDLDADGDLDIVTRDIQQGVYVLRNNGDGTWDRRYVAVEPREGLALLDPDGDGDLDIAINGVWIETPGTAAAPADWLTAPFTLHAYDADDPNGDNQYPTPGQQGQQFAKKVMVSDMNGDGRTDIVVANSEQLFGSSGGGPKGIRVYLAPEPQDAFDPWREIILQADEVDLEDRFSLHTLQLRDLDFDGDVDIVSAITSVGQDNAPGHHFAMMNAGDGMHYAFRSIAQVGHAYNNVIGDVDGDGDAEMFGGGNFGNANIRFFRGISCRDGGRPCCQADLNGNGRVDLDDVVRFAAESPDLNGDGVVDRVDLWCLADGMSRHLGPTPGG
ncbi:MAG: FG-GAP repeat domain-containing protein [Phycisphaerales bacterium]